MLDEYCVKSMPGFVISKLNKPAIVTLELPPFRHYPGVYVNTTLSKFKSKFLLKSA
jgi:hypothetical protein